MGLPGRVRPKSTRIELRRSCSCWKPLTGRSWRAQPRTKAGGMPIRVALEATRVIARSLVEDSAFLPPGEERVRWAVLNPKERFLREWRDPESGR